MNAMPKAMVLAAGLGLRMRPLTNDRPKPLVEVAGKKLIDYTLDWLAASGVEEAVVNSHYLAAMLEAHLATRRAPRMLHVLREDTVLDTGGGIKNALRVLGGAAFFSINSDTICLDGPTPTLQRMLREWDDAAMDALLLLHPVERAVGYPGQGDFFLDENGVMHRRGDAATAPFVYTGIQLLHPRLFKDTPEGAFSLNLLYDRGARENGSLPRVRALVHDGDWLHVGDLDGLKQAERFFAAGNAAHKRSL